MNSSPASPTRRTKRFSRSAEKRSSSGRFGRYRSASDWEDSSSSRRRWRIPRPPSRWRTRSGPTGRASSTACAPASPDSIPIGSSSSPPRICRCSRARRSKSSLVSPKRAAPTSCTRASNEKCISRATLRFRTPGRSCATERSAAAAASQSGHASFPPSNASWIDSARRARIPCSSRRSSVGTSCCATRSG